MQEAMTALAADTDVDAELAIKDIKSPFTWTCQQSIIRYMKHFIVFMVLQARPTYACKFLLTEKTTVQDEMLLEFWKLKPKAK